MGHCLHLLPTCQAHPSGLPNDRADSHKNAPPNRPGSSIQATQWIAFRARPSSAISHVRRWEEARDAVWSRDTAHDVGRPQLPEAGLFTADSNRIAPVLVSLIKNKKGRSKMIGCVSRAAVA